MGTNWPVRCRSQGGFKESNVPSNNQTTSRQSGYLNQRTKMLIPWWVILSLVTLDEGVEPDAYQI